MHNSSRRTGEKLLPNAIRECPVVRGCREKNQGESFLVDTAQGRFGGGGYGFSFISRIVTRNSENRNFCSPLTTISTTLQIESLEESSVIHTKQRLLR